jgi:hypothetical protein
LAINYNPRIITDGLVLCLDAANPKSYGGSGTTWTDLSGRGNNGTLVNGVGYVGTNGGALSFDGVNDYVNLGTPSSLTSLYTSNNKVTVCAWVRINANVGQDIIFDSGSNERIQLDLFGNAFRFTITTSGGIIRTANNPLNINTWNYCIGTYDGTNVSSYSNGSLVSQVGQTGNISSDTSNFIIGNYSILNYGYGLNGNISQVSIYNRALSASEVKQNYNATKSRYGL